jgi:sterol desaturase/sphingolipid hydroxylase (fatty acid hydroxylase superfamily)
VFDDPHDLEIAAFFALMALFEAWERLRPARTIDRLVNWRFDGLCFGLALLINRTCTHSVERIVQAIAPSMALESLAELRALPGWIKIVMALVLVDFALYWLHRAQHRWSFLWRTHVFHHSVDQLWWFSGFRTSFLHSLLYNVPQTMVPMFVFQLSPAQAGVAFAIGVLVQLWEHTNADVDIGRCATS